jgi:hypothetical protein
MIHEIRENSALLLLISSFSTKWTLPHDHSFRVIESGIPPQNLFGDLA